MRADVASVVPASWSTSRAGTPALDLRGGLTAELEAAARVHAEGIASLEKAGFQVDRHGKHIFMSKGHLKVVVPRNNPVDAYTMAPIVRDAGLTVEQFKALL